MIEKLEEFSKYITVAGFKNVKVIDVDEFFLDVKKRAGKACVQFFDADSIAGADHLRFATINALTAFKNKLNISNSVAMETLLYASAQHQIKNSLKLLGISSKSRHVAVLILTETKEQASAILDSISELFRDKRDDSVIEFTNEKVSRIKKIFGISTLEVEARIDAKRGEKAALTELVIEHMAVKVSTSSKKTGTSEKG
jgi:tRNA threonylcarbamoyladenosine modification (KEOPS) complex Cgi121 subunit